MNLINSLFKLKIFLISLTIILSITVLLMIIQSTKNLSINTILNIIELISSIILPFIIGYYFNVYHNQKLAVEELSRNVSKLWNNAKKLESISFDDVFFEENQIMNSNIHEKKKYYQKEVSMLYFLGTYFNNMKWYEHQMYNLPINFKEQIKNICETYLEIDPLMEKYTSISIDVFINSMYVPFHYNYHNTNDILKEFFKLLLSNCDGKYKSIFEEILDDLNNVKIEEYYINGEKCYT